MAVYFHVSLWSCTYPCTFDQVQPLFLTAFVSFTLPHAQFKLTFLNKRMLSEMRNAVHEKIRNAFTHSKKMVVDVYKIIYQVSK